MARLIIKRIQSLRKDSGFEITDRINVVLESKSELEEAVKAFGSHISSQVLANSLTFGDAAEGSEQEFGELKAKVLITKN